MGCKCCGRMVGFVLFLNKYKKEKRRGYVWELPLYTILITLGTFLIYLLSIYFISIFSNIGGIYGGDLMLLLIIPLMIVVYIIWIIVSFMILI